DQQPGCGVEIASGGGHDDAVGAIDELVVGGSDVHHQVAVDRAGAHHHAGGEHVEDQLGGGPGLHAGGAGDDLRTGDRSDGEVDDLGDGRLGDAAEADGERLNGARVQDRAPHVGRAGD